MAAWALSARWEMGCGVLLVEAGWLSAALTLHEAAAKRTERVAMDKKACFTEFLLTGLKNGTWAAERCAQASRAGRGCQ